MFRAFVSLCLSAWGLYAQESPAIAGAEPQTNQQPRRTGVTHVDPARMYYRIYAVVPMIGRGTKDDPKRPMFMSAPAEAITARTRGDRSGILAMQYQLSDDRRTALVEFVAADKAAFAAILTSTDPNVKVFERGKATQAAIETEFRRHKTDIRFAESTVRVP